MTDPAAAEAWLIEHGFVVTGDGDGRVYTWPAGTEPWRWPPRVGSGQ